MFTTLLTRSRNPNTTIDIATTVAAVLAALVVLLVDPDLAEVPGAAPIVVAVVAASSLIFRRRAPLAVVACTIAGQFLVEWLSASEVALLPAVSVALYTVGRYESRRFVLALAAAAALATAALASAIGGEPFGIEFLGETAQALLPIAIGDAAQSRQRHLQARIDAEAEARVKNERLRIARDLHDVVAHGLSVISIHSAVAARVVDDNPAQVREALETINSTGKAALEELRSMVGVLRSSDEGELRPMPTDPRDLLDLIEAGRSRGLDVELRVDGAFPADVADATIVAAHRIVQEALTNVARHAGSVSTRVDIGHRDDAVRIEIRNAAPVADRVAVPSTGVGILGMKERATSLGATLHCGPTCDGGFIVSGVLPYRRIAS